MTPPFLRYEVIEHSVSCHCCFTCSVVDKLSEPNPGMRHAVVCECFEEKDAQIICNLLNEANNKCTH